MLAVLSVSSAKATKGGNRGARRSCFLGRYRLVRCVSFPNIQASFQCSWQANTQFSVSAPEWHEWRHTASHKKHHDKERNTKARVHWRRRNGCTIYIFSYGATRLNFSVELFPVDSAFSEFLLYLVGFSAGCYAIFGIGKSAFLFVRYVKSFFGGPRLLDLLLAAWQKFTGFVEADFLVSFTL